MAVQTMTSKNINALAGNDHPEGWRAPAGLRRLIMGLEERVAYWLRYHATVTELSDLTDRQLADIGIRRRDIAATARSAARQAGA